jgi:flagellar protein FlaJ
MKLDLSKLLDIDKKMLVLILANTGLVVILLSINFILFTTEATIFSAINVISAFIFALPIVMIKYMSYRKAREIEDLFPVFLRDFVEAIRGGMTIPAALNSVARNDYKALTPHIRKMAAQLDWGIPVEKVLLKFAKESKSKLINRIVFSVRESHRFGGNLADTFEALSNTAVEVDRLRAERRLYLHSQMITGYIVFFVFLAVMIGLEKFLVPSLSEVSPLNLAGGAVTAPAQENLAAEYKEMFRNLILIQGLFAGLAVGKMAEGAIVAGLKHSLFMMFVGALIFIIAA